MTLLSFQRLLVSVRQPGELGRYMADNHTIVMAVPCFRLRFHLPQHHSINCDDAELEIPTDGDQPNLRLKGNDGDGSIKSARRLTLSGEPYNSKEDAFAAGSKARHALMRYSIRSRVGIDLGKNRSTGGMSKYLKDKIASETGVQILDDVHGLLVYDGTQETHFANVGASLTLDHQVPVFLELFQQANASQFQPTQKQEVAFELFVAAQFEPSPRSRFLTLVMAIEALLQPAGRDQAVQAHVQSLIDQTKQSALPENEKKSLLDSLKWLFQDSIGRTGKLLAEDLLAATEYGGKTPGSFFRHCYKLRSQLVHDGAIADKTAKMDGVAAELERFVADMLEASIRPIAT